MQIQFRGEIDPCFVDDGECLLKITATWATTRRCSSRARSHSQPFDGRRYHVLPRHDAGHMHNRRRHGLFQLCRIRSVPQLCGTRCITRDAFDCLACGDYSMCSPFAPGWDPGCMSDDGVASGRECPRCIQKDGLCAPSCAEVLCRRRLDSRRLRHTAQHQLGDWILAILSFGATC